MSLTNHRISIDQVRKAQALIDPVFLNSPQYNCEPLSDVLGSELIMKVETFNPIRSFKGRGADFLVSQLGTNQKLMCASAGNFGQAMAYACRKRRIGLTVYASTKANPYKVERMRSLGAEVVLFGDDFDASKEEAKRQAGKSGARMIEDGLAVETAEGAGTMAMELLKAGRFDAVLIPLGNGALFNGIARVFKEFSPSTKMIAVQAAGAPAMVESWRSHRLIVSDKIKTIADGIGVRIPIAEALEDMNPLIDDAVIVAEETLLKAMKLLHRTAGIVPEPSAVVGIAAMMENTDRWKGQRVATVICGGNLTEAQIGEWLS